MEQENHKEKSPKRRNWMKKENFLVIILVGVLLLVVAWPMEKKEHNTETVTGNTTFFAEKQAVVRDEYVIGLEESLQELLQSMEGVGENKVMITLKATQNTGYMTTNKTPEVEGVVVCAQGAGNGKAAKNISEVIQALFGIEAHKIKIVKMI